MATRARIRITIAAGSGLPHDDDQGDRARAPIGDESEAHFQSRVIRLAQILGWKVFHLLDPIGSPAGFPDLLLRRPPRLVWAELKSAHGRVRPPQRAFLDELIACGQEAYIWRPQDFDTIKTVLGAA